VLNIVDIAVSVVLSVVLSAVSIVFLAKKYLFPLLLGVVEEKYGDAKAAISRGMSALGEKSGEVRLEKKLENAVFSDIMAEYPEIQMGLEILSPGTAELIEDNPAMAAKMLIRWGPLLKDLIASISGKRGKSAGKQKEFDY